MADHYEVLQVSPSASDELVRIAYRQRLRESHPDLVGETSVSAFDDVVAAGKVLLDADERAAYDAERASSALAATPGRGGSGLALLAPLMLGVAAVVALIVWSPWSGGDDDVAAVADPQIAIATVTPAEADAAVAVLAAEAVEPETTEDAAEDAMATDASTTAEPTAQPTAPAPTAAPEPTAVPTVEPTPEPTPEPTLVPLSELPARGAVYRQPLLYLEGPVQTREAADEIIETAAAVVGRDNVVDNYIIRPDAPEAIDGNVRVEQAVSFELGSAVIRPEFEGILSLGFAVMLQNPQTTMIVEGHTDNLGPPAPNQTLSETRAQAVVDWLVDAGIDVERLSAVGFGETLPIADNATDDGRAINRRIEIQLVDLLS